MEWRAIEDVWQAWLSETIDVPCIWANQDAPAPPYPYATLEVTSVSAIGASDEIENTVIKPNEPMHSTTRGYRRATINLQIYSAGPAPTVSSTQVRSLMSRAHDSLRLFDIRKRFRDAGVAIASVGNIRAFATAYQDAIVSRTTLDVDFVIKRERISYITYIDTASVEGELDP